MNELSPTAFWISSSLKVFLVVFTGLMVVVAYMTLAERRVSAFIQDRRDQPGGPFGLLQPIADGIKNILKEETIPATAEVLHPGPGSPSSRRWSPSPWSPSPRRCPPPGGWWT
jgi:NADH:ubiquinone oxidoreductase subunit H